MTQTLSTVVEVLIENMWPTVSLYTFSAEANLSVIKFNPFVEKIYKRSIGTDSTSPRIFRHD